MTNQEVVNIRQRYINGETVEQIYKDYTEQYSNINVFRRIILGKSYKEVGNIPTKEDIRYSNAKLTAEQVRSIREEYSCLNTSYAKLGKKYGVTAGCIAGIVKRKTYAHVK